MKDFDFEIRCLPCQFCDTDAPHEIHRSHLRCLSCLRFVTVKKIIQAKLKLARKKKRTSALQLQNHDDSVEPSAKPLKRPRRCYSKYHPKRKKTFISEHHLTPRVRGGPRVAWNMAFLWRDKHDDWHEVFGNCTLEEVIELIFSHWEIFVGIPEKHECLVRIFYNLDQGHALQVLIRLKRFKDRF